MNSSGQYNISAPLRPLRPLVRDAYRGVLGANQEFLSCTTKAERVNGATARNIVRMVAYADRQLPLLSGLLQRPFYADDKTSALFYFPREAAGRWMLGIDTRIDGLESQDTGWNRLSAFQNGIQDLGQDQMEEFLRLANLLSLELRDQIEGSIAAERSSLPADEQTAFDAAFASLRSNYHISMELSHIAVATMREAGGSAAQDPMRELLNALDGFAAGSDAWGLTRQYVQFRLNDPAEDGTDISGREFVQLIPFDIEMQRQALDSRHIEMLDTAASLYTTSGMVAGLRQMLDEGGFSASNKAQTNSLNFLACLLMGIRSSVRYAQLSREGTLKRFSGEVSDIPLEGLGVFFDLKGAAAEFIPGLCRSMDFGIGETSEQLMWNENAISSRIGSYENGVNGIYLVSRSHSGNPGVASVSAYFRTLMNLRAQDVPVDFVRMVIVPDERSAAARCFEAPVTVQDPRSQVFPLAGIFEAFTASAALGRKADDLYFELNKAAIAGCKTIYEMIWRTRIAKSLDVDCMRGRPYDDIALLNGEHKIMEGSLRNSLMGPKNTLFLNLPMTFSAVASGALGRPERTMMDGLNNQLLDLGAEMADRYVRETRTPTRAAVADTRRMRNAEATYVYAFSCAAMQLVSEYLVAKEMIGAHLEERPVVFADQPGVGPKTTPDTAPARVSFAQAQAQQRQEAKARRTEARAEAQRVQQEQERERLLDEAAQKAAADPFEAFACHSTAKRLVVAEALRSEIAGSVKDISDMKALKEKLNGIWVSTDEFLQELRLCDEQAKNRPIEVRMARLIEATVKNILRQMEEEEAPLVDISGQTETLSPNNDAIFTREVTVIKNAIINRKISPRKWLEIQNKAIEYMGLFPWYNPRFMISNLATLISNGEWADGIIEYLDTSIEEQQGLRATFYGSYFLGDDPLTAYLIPTEEEEKANSPE